ncbi:MAG: hypothetical protein E7408_06690 [Ruminococcaceae bacterium]|nr:hypothetical protein [Oscillospiraceae bacterium]
MKALAISIHCDDTEYSIGGTLKLLAEKGWDVTVLNITQNFRDPDRAASDKQSIEAAKLVGAKKIILDYTPGETNFYKNNPDTVRKVIRVMQEISPDVLFTMYGTDNHVEHAECAKTTREAIYAAAVRGTSPNEIYSVECGPFQSMCHMLPHGYICIDPVIDDVKKSMLYFDQSHAVGEGLWKEKEAAAYFRGYEMNTCLQNARDGREAKYAECFRIEKFPAGNSDFLLRSALKEHFSWCSLRMYLPHGNPIFQG